MTRLTCQQTEEQIELFVMGECDEPVRSSVAAHVASCPNCAHSLDQVLYLQGLLDTHFQEENHLNRLFAQVEKETQRRRPRRLMFPYAQAAAALAALFLMGVGLGWVGPREIPQESVDSLPSQKEERFMAAGRPVKATEWESSRQAGRMTGASPIRLDVGQRWICVEPNMANMQELIVATPRGNIHCSRGCFFVSATTQGVAVTIFHGEVVLDTPVGRIMGRKGDLLLATPNQLPSRIVNK
jgi:ferric-dicitrate binding protein FerR (iron transport regulator)